jgi:mycothiol synthase
MTSYRIRVAGEAELAAVAALTAAAGSDEICDYEFDEADELRAFCAGLAELGSPATFLVACDAGGAIAGAAYQFRVPWTERANHHWGVVRVAPEHRRRGLGRALFQRLGELAQGQGARTLAVELRIACEPVARAGVRAGLSEVFRSLPFGLDPRGFDGAVFSNSAMRVSQLGVEIAQLPTLQSSDPEWQRHLHSLYATLIRDVPIPERPLLSIDQLATYIGALPEACFIALVDGRYVGLSFLLPSPSDPNILLQKLTGVLAEQRGRGVALALKLATLIYARDAGSTEIITWIETNNAPMLHLSDRLGFRPLPDGLIVFEQTLPVAGTTEPQNH